jgi:hypothetical protein
MMATNDDKRPDAVEDQSLEVTEDELNEDELEKTAGGLRMDKVGAGFGKTNRLVGNTVTRPRGATVTINPFMTADKDLKGH